MRDDNPFDAFVERSRIEQDELRGELRSYHPLGVMRLWTGRSSEQLLDVTAKRVSEIEREIARIEATIEFVAVLKKAL
jgi:hypothetical protein